MLTPPTPSHPPSAGVKHTVFDADEGVGTTFRRSRMFGHSISKIEQASDRYMRKLLTDSMAPERASCLQPVLEHVLPQFVKYDALAQRWQKRFHRAAIAIYVLSALAVTVSITMHLAFPTVYRLGFIEVAIMAAALVLIVLSHRWKSQQHWLETMNMAERLRAGMFVLMVPNPIRIFPDPAELQKHYPPRSVEILRKAAESLGNPALKACACEDLPVLRRFLLDGWVRDQMKFHERNAHRRHRKAEILEWSLIGFFGLTFLVAVMHALHIWPEVTHVIDIPVLLSISLPAWASAIHGINDLLDHERLAARSRSMADLLESIAARMEAAKTMGELQVATAEAEWVMTSENLEWFISGIFRKLPPSPV